MSAAATLPCSAAASAIAPELTCLVATELRLNSCSLAIASPEVPFWISPLATNTVVVNFEQLAANVEMRAVDVILLDTTFWGGIRPCIKAAGVCETMGLGVAVHSSGELGIQLATMLHLGAVIPNLGYAADAHYHHLVDDVIEGGPLRYVDGAIRVPDTPGLGVALDREKLARYHALYNELGGYPYDRDPGRPGWYPLIPNHDWADPTRTVPYQESGR